VNITVYDKVGNEVITIEKSLSEKGKHIAEIDAVNYSGI
jgi:hypothetical protein